MLIVADVNAVWRSRPFAALSELRPVTALKPMDPLIALKQRWLLRSGSSRIEPQLRALSIVLPFGWATRKAKRALERLWSAVLNHCHSLGADPSGLVVTSPHYAPLVERLSGQLPTYYYCSDDYLNYAGWDPSAMREGESFLFDHVRHSFFVSTALRDRAVRDYKVNTSHVSVCMNATDEEFLRPPPSEQLDRLRKSWPQIKRPSVGVVGGINERLDFDLLNDVAKSDAVASLVLVGGIAQGFCDPKLEALRRKPKCVLVGTQPHVSLSAWCRLVDVALIPFRHCDFNTMCSPMRLFDHIAAGRPIVATNACPQVNEFRSVVAIAESRPQFLDMIGARCQNDPGPWQEEFRSLARLHTWGVRAEQINATMNAS